MSRFRFEPYQSRHSGSIADLIMRPGQARANALRQIAELESQGALQRGQMTSQAIANIGNIASGAVSQYAQQQREEPLRQAQTELTQQRVEQGREEAAQRTAQQRANQVVDRLMQGALTTDPSTGAVTYDRAKLSQGLSEAGIGHLWPQYSELLDKSDASLKRLQESQRGALQDIARLVDAAGNDSVVFKNELNRAIENGAVSSRMAQPYLEAAQRNPQAIPKITAAILGQKPELGERDPTKDLYDKRSGQIVAPGTPATKPVYRQSPDKRSLEMVGEVPATAQIVQEAQLPRVSVNAGSEPLQSIIGPDGNAVLVPRSQAIGKRPASNREQGRPVTSGDAGRIADFDTSLDDLSALEMAITDTGHATGTVAKIGAALPNAVTDLTGWGTDAKKRQGVIDRVKQVIGKTLEGGVLRKEDEYKYEKILPTIADAPDVAASKLVGLRSAITKRRQTFLDALVDSGYDTARHQARPPHGQFSVTAPDGQTYSFPTKGQLDAFKRRAGIK
jgi:predicted transcriptional regulator